MPRRPSPVPLSPADLLHSCWIGLLLLLCATSSPAVTLGTPEGVVLSLGGEGQVTSLSVSSRKLLITPGGGFYAIDLASVPTPTRSGLAPAKPAEGTIQPSDRVYLRAPLKAGKGMQVQGGRLDGLGLALQASYAASPGYLSFSGRVEDLAGRDRAVEIGYEIPLQAAGWTWWNDLRSGRKISAGETYRSTVDCAAGPGYQARYPFSSLTEGRTGVSLGVPLGQGPRVYSLEYDGQRQCLLVRFHLGLSKQVKKLPGQGWFSFLLYQHDGKWGLRSAAERYYRLFPKDFEKRAPYEGYVGYGEAEGSEDRAAPRGFHGVPALGDFGRGFGQIAHLSVGQASVWYDSDDPALPSDDQVHQLLREAAAAQGLGREYGWLSETLNLLGKSRGYRAAEPAWSLLRKLGADAEGRPLWASENGYTAGTAGQPGRQRLDLWTDEDPDLSPALKEWLEEVLVGWSRDNPNAEPYTFGLSIAGAEGPLDFRPEHLAASEMPLTYDRATLKPALADMTWECNVQTLAPLARQYRVLLLRDTAGAFGANAPFLDVGVVRYEETGEGTELQARMSAHRKPLRHRASLPVGTRRPAAVRAMFQRCLPCAIFPDLLPEAPEFRDLYLQYVPVIEQLSAAGWEPVSLARASGESVWAERYGRLADASLAFAVRNTGTEPVRTRLLLDPALGLPAEPAKVEVRNLLTGDPVLATLEQGALALPLVLAAGESTAFSVLTPARQWEADLRGAARCLRQAAKLVPADEITVKTSRPGELQAGESLAEVRADTVLSDGLTRGPRVVFGPGEALQVELDLNSPHRLRSVRVHYGPGNGYERPEAALAGCDRDGNWAALGKVPALPAPDATVSGLDFKEAGEYQLLRLTYPALTGKLCLSEVEVIGEDAALLRATDRFETLAGQANAADLGLISQLAIALRVRRMLGHDRTLQERALNYLADFTGTATGLFVTLDVAPDAPLSGACNAQVVITNRSNKPFREGAIKVKLPPGWSSAPTKFDLQLAPGESTRLPLTLVRSGAGHPTLLVTGSVGEDAIFVSRWF